MTSGTGIMTSVFDHYGKTKKGVVRDRMAFGFSWKTLAYSLFNCKSKKVGYLWDKTDVYIGQIVGLHSRDNDLPVNPTKAKQLTNIRAAGTDENLHRPPHIEHTLEQALEFVEDDELVEVTPKSIRLRKKIWMIFMIKPLLFIFLLVSSFNISSASMRVMDHKMRSKSMHSASVTWAIGLNDPFY